MKNFILAGGIILAVVLMGFIVGCGDEDDNGDIPDGIHFTADGTAYSITEDVYAWFESGDPDGTIRFSATSGESFPQSWATIWDQRTGNYTEQEADMGIQLDSDGDWYYVGYPIAKKSPKITPWGSLSLTVLEADEDGRIVGRFSGTFQSEDKNNEIEITSGSFSLEAGDPPF